MSDDKFMTMIKIGPKGQIIIPKEIRNMFDIKPGDQLVIMADKSRGIALQSPKLLGSLIDTVLNKTGEMKEASGEDKALLSLLLDEKKKKGDSDDNTES